MLRTDDAGRRTMDNGRWTLDDGRWTMDARPSAPYYKLTGELKSTVLPHRLKYYTQYRWRHNNFFRISHLYYKHVQTIRAKFDAACWYLCSKHVIELVSAEMQQKLQVAPLCKQLELHSPNNNHV